MKSARDRGCVLKACYVRIGIHRVQFTSTPNGPTWLTITLDNFANAVERQASATTRDAAGRLILLTALAVCLAAFYFAKPVEIYSCRPLARSLSFSLLSFLLQRPPSTLRLCRDVHTDNSDLSSSYYCRAS